MYFYRMEKIILILLIAFSATVSFSQDIITKKDGTTIEAEVLEITPTLIKYKKYDQEDGPLRSIKISDIVSIKYEDGEIEKFASENETKLEKDKRKKKDVLTESGIFLDFLIGYGSRNLTVDFYDFQQGTFTYSTIQLNYLNLSLQFGNKWYFGQREKWRPGLQVTWVRYNISIEPQDLQTIFSGPKNLSIVNFGMCNIFKFSENTGLELNFTMGVNVEVDFDYDYFGGGLAFNPEIKYRMKNLAIGLNYSRIQSLSSIERSNWDIISLSIGAKF